MGTFVELSGRKFGKLLVLDRAANNGDQTMWNCICECGNEKAINASSLKNGGTLSCGCHRSSRMKDWNHAMGDWHGDKKHPYYSLWQGMARRCYTSTNAKYENYGGRGIRVCAEWRELDQFVKDMGERPGPEYSIDRIDNDRDYEPGNVRWATPVIQSSNRRTVRNMEVQNRQLRIEIENLKEEIQRLKSLVS